MDRVRRVVQEKKDLFLKLPNVVGVGAGFKTVRGKETDRPSVVVLVERKLPKDALAPQALIPEEVDGIPTDVIEVGRLRPLAKLGAGAVTNPGWVAESQGLISRTSRRRPAQPGVSLAHYRVTAGTFGAVVYRRGDRGSNRGGGREGGRRGDRRGEPTPLILSNNHVLANSTSGRDRKARRGDPILQPGPADGGTERDVIARLIDYSPIRRKKRRAAPGESAAGANESLNLMDAALAEPLSSDLVRASILEIGEPQGIVEARVRQRVIKSGRTTGLTEGTVRVTHATVSVYVDDDQPTEFVDQVICTPLSAGGDSGSLVLDRDNRAVGLLFAGSELATIFTPIGTVLDRFGLTLEKPEAPSPRRRR